MAPSDEPDVVPGDAPLDVNLILPRPAASGTSPQTLVLASFVLLLLSFSTYHVAKTYPISQAMTQVLVFGSFLVIAHRHPEVRVRGWSFMLLGANLVTFGAIIEISQLVPFLASPLTHVGTPLRVVLQQVVGHNTGLLLFAYGLYQWVPAFLSSRRVMEDLVHRWEGELVQSQKVAAMASLLSGVTQELKNPLTTVLDSCAVLLHQPSPEQARNAVREISRASQRCEWVFRNLMSLAHPRAHQSSCLSMGEVIGEAIELSSFALSDAGIVTEISVPPDLPTVRGDHDQVLQVFVNLINNARHALGTHEGPRRLAVTARHEAGRVCVSVTDNGPGHSPAEVEKHFTRDGSSADGSDLGLLVCAAIMRAHRGTIEVRSQPRVRTTYTCDFPAGPAAVSAPVPDGHTDVEEEVALPAS